MSQQTISPNNPQISNNIIYLEARPQDLNSLATLFPRAFHPVNPYMKQLCPDTPANRAWWYRIYSADMLNPLCHVLIALDTSIDLVVGSVLLRGRPSGSPFGGFMAEHAPTLDHDARLYADVMSEVARNEERVMGGEARWLVEVVGVDVEYQGRGIGKRLMGWVCEIVDGVGAGRRVFLESTRASGFYVGLGLRFAVVPMEEGGKDRGAGSIVLVREPAAADGWGRR